MTPDQLVRAFCEAWKEPDPIGIASFFTDDGVFHNIPMEPIRGRVAIEEYVANFAAEYGGIEHRIVHQATHGNIVLNERIDVFTLGGRVVELPVTGVYEVEDGRIAALRDYFDSAALGG